LEARCGRSKSGAGQRWGERREAERKTKKNKKKQGFEYILGE
jgi:hypothetical protein